jgi:two-component system response regulator HydG
MLGFDRRTLYRKLERYGEQDGSGGDEGPDKDKAASSPGSASSALS